MKLWIDDLRTPSNEYDIWAKNYEEAVFMLKIYHDELTHISFDHDLGLKSVDAEGNEMSGYKIALYLEEMFWNDVQFPKLEAMQSHSSNYWGRTRIYASFEFIVARYKPDMLIYNAPYESMGEFDRFGFRLNKSGDDSIDIG